jgi:hypothetical protein
LAASTPALDEAEQIRRVYEREAGNYDRNVKLPERLLFSGGREWVCARADGEVLEIAVEVVRIVVELRRRSPGLMVRP